METLPFHSRSNLSYTVIEKLTYDEEKVSSTLIREMIKEGRIESFPGLLGRLSIQHGSSYPW